MTVWDTFTATCFKCGRPERVVKGKRRHHLCRLRWWSRKKRQAYEDGWHSGYRWAAEHPDDPLVARDRDDYGTGWAAHMRSGGIYLNADDEEQQP